MKKSRIVATTVHTAFGENPEWTVLIASNREETVEVCLRTAEAPIVAASLLLSSQDAARRMEPARLETDWQWHADSARQLEPEAVDIVLTSDGILRLDVGSGMICFRLGEVARRKLMQGLAGQ